MAREAELVRTDEGLVPSGEGWFVLNARESRWLHTEELGSCCTFEGEPRFAQLGINVNVLQPGQPLCMYHGENAQEDFLVLAGACVLVVQGQERPLQAWDFVHCPVWAEHVIVGAGAGPSIVLAVGARPEAFGVEEAIRYPVDAVAQRLGACAEEETDSPALAYARFAKPAHGPYRDGDLPG